MCKPRTKARVDLLQAGYHKSVCREKRRGFCRQFRLRSTRFRSRGTNRISIKITYRLSTSVLATQRRSIIRNRNKTYSQVIERGAERGLCIENCIHCTLFEEPTNEIKSKKDISMFGELRERCTEGQALFVGHLNKREALVRR